MSLDQIIDSFSDRRVLVVGDFMIDAYYWGAVKRISPEAPVPVVEVTKREFRLGGAANVALNTAALGANTAMLALIGYDEHGKRAKLLLNEANINSDYMLSHSSRPTTVKSRVISKGQHLLRIDEELSSPINDEIASGILANFKLALNEFKPEVVVLEDYNKGLLISGLISELINECKKRGVKITVDPKKENFWSYIGVDIFKPNLLELEQGLKIQIDPTNKNELSEALKKLQDKLQCQKAFVTLSENGVIGFNGSESVHFKAHPRKILDVSGAGDTVIAIASLALAAGCEDKHIYSLANLGGGLVCEEVGVVPINKELLKSEVKKLSL